MAICGCLPCCRAPKRDAPDVPGYVAVGIWFLFQIVSGVLDQGGGGGVAYSAHIAGFVAGMVLAKPMSFTSVREEADPLVVLRRRVP